MTDLFGAPLNIGDRVIYTTGVQSITRLEVGTIVEFVTKTYTSGSYTYAYLKTASGRRTSNYRGSAALVAVNPIAVQYPELFV
jgi:hypothetical protein